MDHAFELLGRDHPVWLSRDGASADGTPRCLVHLGAERHRAELRPRGGGVFELVGAEGPERVVVACDGDAVYVHLRGQTHRLRYRDALTRFADRGVDDGAALARAPMPGAAISVAVASGQVVQRGEPLLVIESMKMETTIAAPCDGTVRQVHVAIGQTFDRDALLVTLERSEGVP